MGYLSEIRVNWRYVVAAAVGLGSGHTFNMYLSSIFAPHLLQEFGWTKAQFALIGMTILSGAIFMPIAGRITDKLGTRKAATIGVIASPVIYLALAAMTGSFAWFLVLNMLQLMLVGSFTTMMVYNRLIAAQFVDSRGLALAITACTPAITAAAAAPLLTRFIEVQGWRAGYVVLAILVAIAGAVALLLIPRGGGDAGGRGRTIAHDYPALMRDRAFQILSLSKLLGSVTLMVLTTQLKLVLLDRELGSEFASALISVYAVATIGGRFFGGLALDRFPSHIVGFLGYGLVPAIGLLILGAGLESPALLAGAVLILGLAFGADGNITGYLVMRYFRLDIFSTVYSLISVAIAFSAAGGALLLSVTLKASGGFNLFFLISAALVLAAGALVLLLARLPAAVREPLPAAA
jgi:MFS family permease